MLAERAHLMMGTATPSMPIKSEGG